MYHSEKEFRNCRVRYQRLKDAKFGCGWVRSFSEEEVRVLVEHGQPTPAGWQCFLEIYGEDRDALLLANAEAAGASKKGLPIFRFVPTSKVAYRSAMGEARYLVDGITAAVTADDGQIEITVMDISSQGLAIFGTHRFRSSEKLTVHMLAPQGNSSFETEVRYSRPDKRAEGFFRTGLKLSQMDRVSAAKWRSFSSQIRAA